MAPVIPKKFPRKLSCAHRVRGGLGDWPGGLGDWRTSSHSISIYACRHAQGTNQDAHEPMPVHSHGVQTSGDGEDDRAAQGWTRSMVAGHMESTMEERGKGKTRT